jgi:hypothetical protein
VCKAASAAMSYLEDPDTDSDAELVCELSEEEINEIRNQCNQMKMEGNEFFSSQNYEGAIERYSVSFDLPTQSH